MDKEEEKTYKKVIDVLGGLTDAEKEWVLNMTCDTLVRMSMESVDAYLENFSIDEKMARDTMISNLILKTVTNCANEFSYKVTGMRFTEDVQPMSEALKKLKGAKIR